MAGVKDTGDWYSMVIAWCANNKSDNPAACDGHLLHSFFSYTKIDDKSLIEELENRGYDITTLQFTIRRKPKLLDNQDQADTVSK